MWMREPTQTTGSHLTVPGELARNPIPVQGRREADPHDTLTVEYRVVDHPSLTVSKRASSAFGPGLLPARACVDTRLAPGTTGLPGATLGLAHAMSTAPPPALSSQVAMERRARYLSLRGPSLRGHLRLRGLCIEPREPRVVCVNGGPGDRYQ